MVQNTILPFVCITLLFVAVKSAHVIDIDDLLNGDVLLFPNQTVHHQHDFEDQTVEHFQRFLDDDEVLEGAYNHFKVKYGERQNTFGNIQHTHRKQLFKENLVYIFHHNLHKRMRMHSSFEMGVNKFADMHIEEFRQERLGLHIPEDFHINQFPSRPFTSSKNRSIPPNFDWREYGVITPVKDQGKCGSCVMFAITAALEGTHAINHEAKQTVGLSEQFMLDCATKENGYQKNDGCKGNTFPDTLKFTLDHGVTSEELYPYQGEQSKCTFEGMKIITHPKKVYRVSDTSDGVKDALVTMGPVPFGMYVYKPFMFYKSGVYDVCLNPSSAIGGHAMTITGFNDDAKKQYYVMKNQWGPDWGENGYIRHISGDSKCSIEKLAFVFGL